MKILNAQIIDTKLGRESNGYFTFTLFIDMGNERAVIGNYILEQNGIFHQNGLNVISDILDVVGVSTWEELAGKYIRVKWDETLGNIVDELGHIIQDRWISIRSYFEVSSDSDGE